MIASELDITPLVREGVFGKGQAGQQVVKAVRKVRSEGAMVWVTEDGMRVAALVSAEAGWLAYGIREAPTELEARIRRVQEVIEAMPADTTPGSWKIRLREALNG